MSKPVPFSAHVEQLLAGFRTAIPQVGALLPFMPDALLHSFTREVRLIHETAEREVERREHGGTQFEKRTEE